MKTMDKYEVREMLLKVDAMYEDRFALYEDDTFFPYDDDFDDNIEDEDED